MRNEILKGGKSERVVFFQINATVKPVVSITWDYMAGGGVFKNSHLSYAVFKLNPAIKW